MIKLIKHELSLRKVSVFKIGIAAAVINIITVIMIFVLNIDAIDLIQKAASNDHASMQRIIATYGILPGIIFPLVFALNGIILFMPVMNAVLAFKRDHFSKERYLIFSLPVKSSQIIGSRIAVACIDFGTALLLITVFMFGIILALVKGEVLGVVVSFVTANLPMFILGFAMKVFEFGLFMLAAYTAFMVLSFVIRIPDKWRKKLGFIIGIVLLSIFINIWDGITEGLKKLVTTFQFSADTSALQAYFLGFNNKYLHLPNYSTKITQFDMSLNIAVISAEILMFVILFKSLSYFIDKRLEI